ncbi:MAG: SpoIID/LytB domain-containing protein [Bacillota bacterium]
MRHIKLLGLTVLVLGALMGSGCPWAPFKRTEPGPQGKSVGTEPTISLHLDATGQTRQLKLEEYILGVVAAEMDPSWPLEALKSQAIVARTFTLQKVDEGKARELHGTDACDNKDHFQAYDPSKVNDAVKRAVQETRGLVLTYDAKPIRAFFHSNSGGKTCTAEEGLNFTREPTPYLVPVDDPYSLQEAPQDKKAWTASFGTAEVRAALSKLGKEIGAPIRSFVISKRGPSGRATSIAVNGVEVVAADLRTALGPDRLKSTLIDGVTLSSSGVKITGKGWGHGVGLSQWGAMAMAKAGKKAEQMVKFYYPKAALTRMW